MFEVFNYFFNKKDYNLPKRANDELSTTQKEALDAWKLHFANFNPVRDALHNTLQTFKIELDNVKLEAEEGTNIEANAATVSANDTKIKIIIEQINNDFAKFNCVQRLDSELVTLQPEIDSMDTFFQQNIGKYIPKSNGENVIAAKQAFQNLLTTIGEDFNAELEKANALHHGTKALEKHPLATLTSYLQEKLTNELDSLISCLNSNNIAPETAITQAKNVISSMQHLAKLQRVLDAIFVRNWLAKSAIVHDADKVEEYNLELGRQMISEFKNCKTHGENNVFPETHTGPMPKDKPAFPSATNQIEIEKITREFFYSMVCKSFDLSESITDNPYYKNYVQGFLYNKLNWICSSGHEHAKFYDFHAKQMYANLNYAKSIEQLKFSDFHYYIDCATYATHCLINFITNKYTLATLGSVFALAVGGTFLYPQFNGNIDKAFLTGCSTIKQEALNLIKHLANNIPSIPSIW